MLTYVTFFFQSYYITDIESKLLNEINLKHTDCHFGKEAFTSKDMVVRLSDSKEFYRFLDLCYKKLVLKKSNATDRLVTQYHRPLDNIIRFNPLPI